MKFLRPLYLNNRLFFAIGVVVVTFIISFLIDRYIIVPKVLLFIFLACVAADFILLYGTREGVTGARKAAEKLSNGDDNEILIFLRSNYSFSTRVNVVDEIPHQFQKRDLSFKTKLSPGERKTLPYSLRPVKRGEYSFGAVNVFVSSPLGLIARRFRFSADVVVPVYPSYIQMRRYELLAISNRLTDSGVKKIRRIGQNMEFELIKEYVSGDDFRTINWSASARKNHLMVNHFQDERSQQVYSLIDKGRVMQMPFNGLSLLDYAINACLVISNIAIRKTDKAGLVTFQDKIGAMVPASKQSRQMAHIMEVLYKQKTAYRETDMSLLYSYVRRKISQRSLLLMFTNFESVYALQRQLPFLKGLANQHLLVVIFFENTEMKSFVEKPSTDLRDIYHKGIAEKLVYDKKLIVKELTKHGIQALLTTPEQLTVNTINKYLELKARGMI